MHINQPKSPPYCRDSVLGFRGKLVVFRRRLCRFLANQRYVLTSRKHRLRMKDATFGLKLYVFLAKRPAFWGQRTGRLGSKDRSFGAKRQDVWAEKACLFGGTVPTHACAHALVADKKSKRNRSPTRYLKVCQRTHIR